MQPQRILPPTNTFAVPDSETQKGLPDYTGPSADKRVLHINLFFFKFGTDDKVLATSFVLSLILLVVIIYTIHAGLSSDRADWIDKVFTWSTSTFIFVVGVALGKGAGTKNDEDNKK